MIVFRVKPITLYNMNNDRRLFVDTYNCRCLYYNMEHSTDFYDYLSCARRVGVFCDRKININELKSNNTDGYI